MPLFLAGLLVRGGAVAPDVMEEALQRQVLYGGALDTNLLEIGAIDEITLAPYLARASGLQLAPFEAFQDVEPRVRRAFPARLAERHGVVPFRLEGRTLEVACVYPVEGSLIDEISFMLSLILRPHVAMEFRVRLAVERMYGHAAAQRFHALQQRSLPRPAPAAAPPPGAERRDDGDGARSEPPTWSVDHALDLLQQAPDRDRAIEVVLRFARRVFDYAAAFVVLGGNAIGWDAVGPDPAARRRVTQVALPVEAPSILRTVVETGGRYLGPIPADEHHAALLEALGRRPPRSAFLQTVAIGNRVVAIVFADNGERTVSPLGVAQVMRLVQGLSPALQAMILARKAAMAESVDEALTPPAGVSSAVGAIDGAAPTPVAAEQRPAPGSITVRTAAPIRSASTRAPVGGPDAPLAARARMAGQDATDPAGRLPPRAIEEKTDPAGFPMPPAGARPSAPAPRRGPAPTERARRAVELLLSARSEPEREQALDDLENAGAPAAEVLVALLPGPGGSLKNRPAATELRPPVVRALARLGDAAVPSLLRASRSSSPAVRFWAAALLSRSRLAAAGEALVALSSDPDSTIAELAHAAVLAVVQAPRAF